jgi:hypothetical protein
MPLNGDGGRARWRVLAIVFTVVAGTGIVTLTWFFRTQGLSRSADWANPLQLLLDFAAIAVTAGAWMIGRSRAAGPSDAKALARLRQEVAATWSHEIARRDPHLPLQLRWRPTRRAGVQAARVPAGDGTRAGSGTLLDVDGRPSAAALAAALDDPGVRQVVVLGEPGAGKTTLALLYVVEANTADAPVAVPLPIAPWDPGAAGGIEEWVVERIARDYPQLTAAAVRQLVRTRTIVPVLDGLDEMPPANRGAALTRLGEAAGAGLRMILTCRSAEFVQATAEAGVLPQAVVVEVEPVGAGDAVAYLTEREASGSTRWDPVVAALTGDPHGPLASALSTPLMIGLARQVFAKPTTDPAQLAVVATAEAVRERRRPVVLRWRPGPAPGAPAARRRRGGCRVRGAAGGGRGGRPAGTDPRDDPRGRRGGKSGRPAGGLGRREGRPARRPAGDGARHAPGRGPAQCPVPQPSVVQPRRAGPGGRPRLLRRRDGAAVGHVLRPADRRPGSRRAAEPHRGGAPRRARVQPRRARPGRHRRRVAGAAVRHRHRHADRHPRGSPRARWRAARLAFSPDGRTVAVSVGQDPLADRLGAANPAATIGLWDVATGRFLVDFGAGYLSAAAITFTQDGSTIVADAFGGDVELWSAAGERVTVVGHVADPSVLGPNDAPFSADGRTVVVVDDDGRVQLRDTSSGRLTATLGPVPPGSSIRLGPDARTLAIVSDDGTVGLWDVAAGRIVATVDRIAGTSGLIFSPDGRTVATVNSDDRRVRLWRTSTGRRLALLDPVSLHTDVAFGSDGRTVLTEDESNGALRLWDVPR